MVWGIEGSHKIREELLEPLGLVCYGGIGDRYTIRNDDNSFVVNIKSEEFKNIEQIYKEFLRKKKLEKLNESIRR